MLQKITHRIWDLKFVGMEELLPSKLGSEPSVFKVHSTTPKNKSSKRIECIEQRVCCFNIYVAVMAMKHPEKVVDLLAHSSLIVNASRSYEGMPWLDYDNHFRCAKAADHSATGSLQR